VLFPYRFPTIAPLNRHTNALNRYPTSILYAFLISTLRAAGVFYVASFGVSESKSAQAVKRLACIRERLGSNLSLSMQMPE
jgi:hypothetical protein